MNKKNLLNVKDVSHLLGIAEKTIRKYVWEKTIPYYKLNGHVRFDQDEILKWVYDRRVQTLEEIQYGSRGR